MYWRERQPGPGPRKHDWVKYGNDVDGSGFADCGDDPLADSGWNLQGGLTGSLPSCPLH